MSKIQEYREFQGNLNLKADQYAFGSEQTQWQGGWSVLPGSLQGTWFEYIFCSLKQSGP